MKVQFAEARGRRIPVHLVSIAQWPAFGAALSPTARALARVCGFEGKSGQHLLVPGEASQTHLVLFGLGDMAEGGPDIMLPGKLAGLLPPGVYELAGAPALGAAALEAASLSWLLGSYVFDRFRSNAGKARAQLVAPHGIDRARVERIANAVWMARDLVNTPANEMGPQQLEEAALRVARQYSATVQVIRGEALLKKNFPLIHAVGRAGPQPPRLVDMSWGPANAPRITLVGKGVCFDTGGLDIKPSAAMLMMKKDMAGAAIALGLAQAIMDAKLHVRLRVLLPIVENSVSSNSFRPGDVYKARNGVTVEIGNTDAEGRLILADALTLGAADNPELMFDFATLTGAARVATGPDLPAFFCTSDALADEIYRTGIAQADPVWRLPLWEPYNGMLASKIADTNNVSSGPFAGSITAALFLKKFISGAEHWAHFDVYAWNATAKPGRPEGAEAQTLRLLYALLEARYAQKSPAAGAKRVARKRAKQ